MLLCYEQPWDCYVFKSGMNISNYEMACLDMGCSMPMRLWKSSMPWLCTITKSSSKRLQHAYLVLQYAYLVLQHTHQHRAQAPVHNEAMFKASSKSIVKLQMVKYTYMYNIQASSRWAEAGVGGPVSKLRRLLLSAASKYTAVPYIIVA